MHQHSICHEAETAYFNQYLTLRGAKYTTKYVYIGDSKLASKMDPDWFQYPPTLYYHQDHLGSTEYVTNDEQFIVQHDEYLPSGELWRNETDSQYELSRVWVYDGPISRVGTCWALVEGSGTGQEAYGHEGGRWQPERALGDHVGRTPDRVSSS